MSQIVKRNGYKRHLRRVQTAGILHLVSKYLADFRNFASTA
jgi:hypothetical protein